MKIRRGMLMISLAVILAWSGSAGAKGTIQNKGSDTLVNVAQAWAEEYARQQAAKLAKTQASIGFSAPRSKPLTDFMESIICT